MGMSSGGSNFGRHLAGGSGNDRVGRSDIGATSSSRAGSPRPLREDQIRQGAVETRRASERAADTLHAIARDSWNRLEESLRPSTPAPDGTRATSSFSLGDAEPTGYEADGHETGFVEDFITRRDRENVEGIDVYDREQRQFERHDHTPPPRFDMDRINPYVYHYNQPWLHSRSQLSPLERWRIDGNYRGEVSLPPQVVLNNDDLSWLADSGNVSHQDALNVLTSPYAYTQWEPRQGE